MVNTSSVDEMEGYTCVRGRLCLLPTSHTIADCIACHVCSLAGPPLGCDLCKLPQTSVNEHAKGAQDGGRGEEGEKKKKEGVGMLGRTPAPLIMIKRFSPKDGGVAVLLRS